MEDKMYTRNDMIEILKDAASKDFTPAEQREFVAQLFAAVDFNIKMNLTEAENLLEQYTIVSRANKYATTNVYALLQMEYKEGI